MVPEGVPRGPAGDVRAFDVRTGKEVWRFHTVPRPGELGHETWPRDGWQRRTGANVWSAMTVDHQRGLVFLPIGSASYDFFGGDRKGRNLFANSLVALDAATGVRRWHQQLVHHDIWDYDPPSQPILADVPRNGSTVPVVIQLTKMGLVFVFERETGLPIFGMEERAMPRSEVPGEEASPTQPFPIAPAPLVRTRPVTRDDLTRVTPQSREECERLFERVTSAGLYTPPGLTPTLLFPGTMGGATWSGGAVDPVSSLLVVNTNEVGAIAQMVPRARGRPAAVRARGRARGVRPLLGQSAVALPGAAVGQAQRHRSADGADRLAGAARQRARAGGTGHHGHRLTEPGRPDRHGRGARVHRRGDRQPAPRIRPEDGAGGLAGRPPGQRAWGAGDAIGARRADVSSW